MNKKPIEPDATLENKAYGYAIRSALRKCGLFLQMRSDSKVIGLTTPPDAAFEAYRDATRAVLKSSDALDHYHVASIMFSRRGETMCEDAQDTVRLKSAVVVLIESGCKMPPEFELAFDRIVQVDPVKPAHLISAAKDAWRIRIGREHAVALAQYRPKELFAALRKGRPIDAVLGKLAVATSARSPAKWEPRLEELEGYGHARDWGTNLVSDLADWRVGRIAWRDVDAGLLLSGPPGSGKTLFAQALARSCGAHFIGTSSAQWQSKGHLGDLLGAMRKSFRDAKENAPTVLLIDEIDAIGDRRSFRGDNAGYSTQVVNALLELLDGSDDREGVVVVAASNYPDNLDSALRRPGRLDRHIIIDLPDQAARAQMLATHLELSSGATEALQETAKAMSGYSGALIAQVAKDARRIARKQGRDVEAADVLALVPPLAALGSAERWAACIHEAGHAVVGLELAVAEIEMIVVAKEVGHRDGSIGHVQWRRRVTRSRSRQSYLDEIAMMLGGMAAEKVVLGDVFEGSGGADGSDLQRASDLATLMLASMGLGALLYCDVSTSKDLDELRRQNSVLRRQVERLLEKQLERAEEIIQARTKDVHGLAELLMGRDVILGQEVLRLIGRSPGDHTAA
ncbi:ATPase [Metarhizobium album]|uniref:ATPase n=1 Tax=Metarhizobium album TaxID=2182425 RepID=A0A2U2DQC2_9HYPH|nr:AAA family ATPase [Rhizobium album]PWE55508.1 ATPase [Rhizobium album]